jgi:hypothetical protein
MKQNLILWLAAVVLTFLIGYLGAVSGEHYPFTNTIMIEGQRVSVKLDKITDNRKDYEIFIRSDAKDIDATAYWRKKNENDWNDIQLINFEDETFTAQIQKQPASTEIDYFVEVEKNNKVFRFPARGEVNLLFTGYVSPVVTFLFYFTLFTGLFLNIRTGLEYFNSNERIKKLAIFTLIFFILFFVVTPLYKTYQLDLFNRSVPPVTELFNLKSIFLLSAWVLGLAAVFNLENRRLSALAVSIAVVLIFLLF